MKSKQEINPAEPLPKESDEKFCQLVANGNEPFQAYQQAVYTGTDFSSKQKFKTKAYRKMKQDHVRARVEYLREQVRQEARGIGIEKKELIKSLTQKYWEAFNAKCETMRDRADQARVLEVLANRISLLTGLDKVQAPPPKLNFIRRESRESAVVAPPPGKEGGGHFSEREGESKKTRPEELE